MNKTPNTKLGMRLTLTFYSGELVTPLALLGYPYPLRRVAFADPLILKRLNLEMAPRTKFNLYFLSVTLIQLGTLNNTKRR